MRQSKRCREENNPARQKWHERRNRVRRGAAVYQSPEVSDKGANRLADNLRLPIKPRPLTLTPGVATADTPSGLSTRLSQELMKHSTLSEDPGVRTPQAPRAPTLGAPASPRSRLSSIY
ncbi:unnamed protein product [Pleuronectes platessa]|uniref:Uncharacterized protein n=1 Tax=Pleuronectes platessa TaxID=8262 RepID=A0A9N7U139_PLEPL|nr:unnamed protein product [Pleuronectes platessa]